MPLRLAFDLDGVLADMETALAKEVESLFGSAMAERLRQPSPDPPPDEEKGDSVESAPAIVKMHLTGRQQRRLWRHIATVHNFWESLEETEPGIVAKLGATAAERRWEVIFLTKRPVSGGALSQIQTQRWLEAKGFKLPSVFVVQGNRGRIAAALDLDFVVDDTPENCLDIVVDSKAKAVLVWREGDRQLPVAAKRLGIGVVKSVEECLNVLAQADEPSSPEGPRVVDRILQLLGIKNPSKT